MNLPEFFKRYKKGLVKTINVLTILLGAFLLFYYKMAIAGTLLIVLGYFSVLKKND